MTETRVASDLLREVEQFLYLEADLLDDRCFHEWLELFDDDLQYRMPIVRNLRQSEIKNEYLESPLDVAWIDEGKETLSRRVEQILTGVHWAEEPLSRTAHLVTNVRIVSAEPSPEAAETVSVRCRFLSYRHRLLDQENTLIGKRHDILRRLDGSWKIARREIYVNQPVLLTGNLSHFV